MSSRASLLLLCLLGLALPPGCGDKDADDSGGADGGGDGGGDGGTGDGGSDGGAGDGGADGGEAACSDEDADGDGFSECEGDCLDEDDLQLPGASSYRQRANDYFEVALSSEASDLHLADLDADGVPDALVAVPGLSAVLALRGQGDGSFATLTSWSAPVAPSVLTAADFDGDDIVDVAWANMEGDVVVHLGTGAGSFDPTGLATPTACGQDGGIDTGDLDGDGLADLLLACGEGGAAVLRSAGDGTFEAALLPEAPGDAAFVRDFDGDGHLDLLVGGDRAPARLLWGDGTGSFGGSESLPGEEMATGALGVLDANGDGAPDIALLGLEYGLNAVALNAGDRAFDPGGVELIGIGDGWDAAGGLDVDGDGDEDLWMHDRGWGMTVFLSDEGRFDAGWSEEYTIVTNGLVSAFAPGDLDLDGHLDLAWTEYSPGKLVSALWQGDGDYGSALEVDDDTTVDAAAGDLDGDGDDDVVVATTGSLKVHRADAGALTAVASWRAVGTAHGVAVTDLDGDGFQDVVSWGRSSATTPPVWISWGDGSMALGETTSISPEGATYVSQFHAGDIDGDGLLDLVMTDTLDAVISLYRADGPRSYVAAGTLSLHDGSSFDASKQTVLADLDGDGDLDLVGDDYGTANLQVFTNDGTGSFAPAWREEVGNIATLRAADLDGDGATDLLVAFEVGGQLAILWGDNSAVAWEREDIGTSWATTDALDLVDFTGEGHLDLVTCTNDQLDFHLGDGTGSFSSSGPLVLQTSSATCRPLLADLDADGVDELLVAAGEDGLAVLERACP